MIDLNLSIPFTRGFSNMTYSSNRTLSCLLQDYPIIHKEGPLELKISSIVCDSRKVEPGSLFFAIPGESNDGVKFISDAAACGAAAIVTERPLDSIKTSNFNISTFVQVLNSRNALAIISSRFYGEPSKKINLIGVTGTNGKTTVSYILESILNKQEASAGVIGTIEYRYGGKSFPASLTTPESIDINRMLNEMRDQFVRYCVLEVSSHALTFQRVSGLDFAVTVFTNLSRDHLDFHGNLENYILSKKTLFRDYPKARSVINTDDLLGLEIYEENPSEVITTGIHKNADVMAENIKFDPKGVVFDLKTPVGNCVIRSPLLGKHNIYNILSSVGAAIQLGISLDNISNGVETLLEVPGRFERLDFGQDFTVVVDYAHTDDALKNILKAARILVSGRVIVVFGCGGDRFRDKRGDMGRAAIEGSEFAIITSDNPRSESPDSIIQDIVNGLPGYAVEGDHFVSILSRRRAIEFAINIAKKDDIVIIAGKGHEDYQILSSETIHFDDREVVADALKKRLNFD